MCTNFAKLARKIVGVAANSKQTLSKTNSPQSERPIIFLKPSSSIIEEGESIVLPKVYNTINHEVELGVIIGKKCKNIQTQEAENYIAGYCLALDLTAMDEIVISRKLGYPWDLGKGFDTATPVSRFIEPHEIRDRNNTKLWLKVNGVMRQEDTTADLVVGVDELIAYISQHMKLEENDIILTGTPYGIDKIKHGDHIECGLDDFLTCNFKVVAESECVNN